MNEKHAKKKKLRRMTPFTPRWWRLAAQEAMRYTPPVKPCKECGGPVISGYCCARCGSTEP